MRPTPPLYLFSIKSYWQKTVDDLCDLGWPFKWPLGVNSPLESSHVRWKPWLWKNWVISIRLLATENNFIFPPLVYNGRGHEPDLTSGHEYKKSEIYKSFILIPLCSPEKKKLIEEKLWIWQAFKIFLRWGHVTASGDLTWDDLGPKILHSVRKGCSDRHWKFRGATRRRFFAILKKPEGGGRLDAPPRPNMEVSNPRPGAG